MIRGMVAGLIVEFLLCRLKGNRFLIFKVLMMAVIKIGALTFLWHGRLVEYL